jgi:hypothetical protein
MNGMKRKQELVIALFALATAAVAIFWPMSGAGATVPRSDFESMAVPNIVASEEDIVFSHQDYFYERHVWLSFQATNEDIVEFYYTLDGKPPNGEAGIL